MWNLKKKKKTDSQRQKVGQWWGREVGKRGDIVKGYKVVVHRVSKSRGLMLSVMTVVNNPVLNTGHLLGE